MLKWVMAGPQVLHQELAEMSTVISRVKPVLIVLETGRQIGPVTQTQTNDPRAVKALAALAKCDAEFRAIVEGVFAWIEDGRS